LPNYLGLDGFRFGWVAAWIDDRGDHGFDYSPGLVRLLALPHARAMIDMPIGLKWSGYRICDLRARELVGAAVFLGARRDLWKFADMAAANRHYWECEGKGKGVSAQLWNIRDKIRDADEIMTPTRQTTIGEAHPELIFWNLAGRAPACKEDVCRGPGAAHRTRAAARLRALADMADSTIWHRHRP
jgi:predicted RNase H-like nuclease